MAISGDLRVSATLNSTPVHSFRSSLPISPSKVGFTSFLNGGSGISELMSKRSFIELKARNTNCHCLWSFGAGGDSKLSSPRSMSQEAEGFLLNAINLSFFERLNLAWKILFPAPIMRRNSNANIAKQRLKMILFSDRCAVSDEAKRRIVSNIVGALSDFVEIDSEDKVQLSVSTDAGLGTIYSVTVPVRRVKPEYQDEYDSGTISNMEYKDTGEGSGSVDVTFDFFIPNDKTR